MKTLDEKKRDRFLFLQHIYNIKDQPGLQLFNLADIGESLGVDRIEALTIADYLANEGLISLFDDEANIVALTHQGAVEVEAVLSKPTEPTEHFLPFNYIHVENMTNSQINQGSTNTNQTQNITQNHIEKFTEFVRLFEENVKDLAFESADAKNEAIAEVSTIRAQLSSPKPKYEIIRQAGQSVKSILEKAAGSMIAEKLLELLASSL